MIDAVSAAPWQPVELEIAGSLELANPYTDQDVWVDFRHDDGTVLRRPAFWDGGTTWRVRFASPESGRWTAMAHSRVGDRAVGGWRAEITVDGDPGDGLEAPTIARGLLRYRTGERGFRYADGTPWLMVADTAWALPWRASAADAEVYAADRQAKGFNAVLLMSVQPDTGAVGPHDRAADQGFDVGFTDLPDGRLTQLQPSYFQTLDVIMDVLAGHGITPVLTPTFHGFGWKGLDVVGPMLTELDAARYARYLVARYGASPLVYLVGADGRGDEPSVAAAGREVQAWDCYGQPTGIHYRPHCAAAAHQDADWLDFQACQTGHEAEHLPERVGDLWRNRPVRAVLNGEPTYEHSGRRGKAAGWWQGHEAWGNLCAGGTAGVVYGAGSIWQWRHHRDEPGFSDYFLAEGCGWREALDFEGSRFVGLVGRILAGLPIGNAVPDWQVALGGRGLFDPDVFYLNYREHGGRTMLLGDTVDRVPLPYRIVDPRTGETRRRGRRTPDDLIIDHDTDAPSLLLCWPDA